MINKLCGIDLSLFEFVDKELITSTKTKEFVLDNLLKDEFYNYVIVEMQKNEANYKNYSYLFRVSGNLLNVGEKYKLNRVSLIQFKNSIPRDLKDERVLLHFRMCEEYSPDMIREFVDSYEIILPNVEKVNENNLNDLDKKLLMFLCSNYKDMAKYVVDTNDEELIERIKLMCEDENFRFMYNKERALELEKWEAREYGKNEGILIGEKQGIEEEKRKLVSSLLKKGYSSEYIIDILDLSEKEFDSLLIN